MQLWCWRAPTCVLDSGRSSGVPTIPWRMMQPGSSYATTWMGRMARSVFHMETCVRTAVEATVDVAAAWQDSTAAAVALGVGKEGGACTGPIRFKAGAVGQGPSLVPQVAGRASVLPSSPNHLDPKTLSPSLSPLPAPRQAGCPVCYPCMGWAQTCIAFAIAL